MADWVLKGSLKGPQGDPGETPDLSAYATTEELTQAVSAESSAREKADELLQSDVDAKMAPGDVVAGENVSVSVGGDGKVTVSAEPGLPDGGTTGQVLTKTASGSEWQDAQTIDTPVPVSQGGTGATTADGARTALGISVADPDELVEYIKSKLGA